MIFNHQNTLENEMRRLSIPEVLEQLEGKSQEEVVKILRTNDTRSLRLILYVAFSKEVESNLPDVRPEGIKLQETPEGLSINSLYQQSRKIRIFIKNSGYDHLSDVKREHLFLQILESIHSSEAELLLQILIDRELKSSLKYEDVRLSFSGLLPELVEEVKESKPKKLKKKPAPKPEPKVEEVKEEPKQEPVVEEPSKEEEVEELEDRIEDLEEALEDLKSDLDELNEEEPPKEEPKPVVKEEPPKEESKSFKNLSEVYEKKSEKKTKTKKKSSKKKSK